MSQVHVSLFITSWCNLRVKMVINHFMSSGRQYCIHANGDFAMPARCWFHCGGELGNVRDMLSTSLDSKWLRGVNRNIKLHGLPPTCQRLCCAGKTV